MTGFIRRHRSLIMTGSTSQQLATMRKRIVFMLTIFMLCYLAVIFRMAELMIVMPAQQEQLAEEKTQREDIKSAQTKKSRTLRANITDRNGILLATSLEMTSLYADPTLIRDPKTVTQELAALFPEIDTQKLEKELSGKKRFVWIKRHLTPHQYYEANRLGIPGLAFMPEYRRVYPQGATAAHVVGFSDVDGRGIAGAEKSLDARLREESGDIALAIDLRIQHALTGALDNAIQKFSARGGMGIVTDLETGEILALASLPDFDPNAVGSASPEALFNKATLGVYEMGSAFKVFTVAAALENRSVREGELFDVTKPLQVGRFRIRDFHPQKTPIDLQGVMVHSSNIGSALIAEKMGGEKLRAFFDATGLTRPAPVELPEVGRPLVPSPWRPVNTLTASYGHGIAVSPLQLLVAGGAVARDGHLPKPTILKRDGTGSKQQAGTDAMAEDDVGNAPVLSPKTSRRMRELMQLAVTEGTGSKAAVAGYPVGGKTGTAEKLSGGIYSKKEQISSFMGFFPIANPRYGILVAIDEPKGTKDSYGYATGGWAAAPAFAEVVEKTGPILGIAPEWEHDKKDMKSAALQ